MGGWSGGVYTRFRNWVNDKANSINPQAALFDQEDDGFAGGLNNCVTKDGLNKPSSAMDWNGQNLSGVLNLTVTGTVSFGGLLTATGGLTAAAPIIGTHDWATDTGTFQAISSTTPMYQWSATGQAANAKLWRAYVSGLTWNLDSSTDNQITTSKVLLATRTAASNALASIVLGNTTDKPAIQFSDPGGTLQSVGYRNVPQNSQAGNYTTVLADNGKHVLATGSGSTITIAANASVPYELGAAITVVAGIGSGSVSLAVGGTDTLQLAGTGTTGTRTLAPGAVVTALKVATTVWYVNGAGMT